MTCRVAVIGAGTMGAALVGGLVRAEFPRHQIAVADIAVASALALQDTWGVRAVPDAVGAAASADVVFIVTRPPDVLPLLADISSALGDDTAVVSLAAGVATDSMRTAVRPGPSVIRAVPNTPALFNEAVSVISPGETCAPAHLARVTSLMSLLGTVIVLPEELQDVATAISGSGPAYGFYLAEAMVSAGVALGLRVDDAHTLVSQTLVGAGRLLQESGDSAEELRRRVTSPNGTTAAAIATFDENDVMRALQDGIARAARRAVELGLSASVAVTSGVDPTTTCRATGPE